MDNSHFDRHISHSYEHEKLDDIYDDENTNLYLLFIKSKLMQSHLPAIPVQKKRSLDITNNSTSHTTHKKSKHDDYIYNLTPFLKQYVTPTKALEFHQQLHYDQLLVNKLDSMIDDDDYKNYENHGKLVECWYADNMPCPVCNQKTLRRYQKDNFPAIDVVCINPDHLFSHGVKFFQIKSTSSSSLKPYFDLTNNTIHTGSYAYGKTIHNVSIFDSDIFKKILVGYICINFTERTKFLTINKQKSFIVLPKTTNIDNISKKLFSDDFSDLFVSQQYSYNYYTYINIENPEIQFDQFNSIFGH